jgi:hypothetical protein
MERTIKMQVDLPESFSNEIEKKLLDMRQSGVRKSKAQYIVELAQIAFLQKQVKADLS